MPRRTLLGLLATSAVLAAPTAVGRRAVQAHARNRSPRAPAARPRPSTASRRAPPPTSCGAAATPSTPRSPRRPCSASRSRSRAASAAAASWSSARRTARSPRSTRARRRRPRCARTRSSRTARRCRSTTRATAGSPAACPAPWPAGTARCAGTARGRSAARCDRRSTSRARASSSTRRSTPRCGQRPVVRRHPSTAELYLEPDGPPTRRRGRSSATPTWHVRTSGSPSSARKGFYRGAIADALVEAVQDPPLTARRRQRVAPRADDDARPARVHRARARAHARRVPRAGRLRHGPAVVGRLDRRRGAEHPRAGAARRDGPHRQLHWFLEASRFAFADRNAYLADPAFFDVPLDGLLSESFAAERHALIDRAGRDEPVAPGDPYDDQPAAPAGGFSRRAVDHAPDGGRRRGHRRLVHVHDRVDGRQRDRRARAGASSSTTS